MPTTSPSRRRGLLAVVALLVVVDGALLAGFAFRRKAPSTLFSVEMEPSDPRVAPVFAALEASGLAAALDTLEQRASTDSLVLRAGHQLAHAVGRGALLRSGGDAKILQSCRPGFASGCYHGVVEALLGLHGEIDMLKLEVMCTAAGDVGPGPVYECVHGLGHGVLGAVRMDVGTALRHCDSLDRASFVASCHQGVFMEAIASGFRRPGNHGGHAHGATHHSQGLDVAVHPDRPYSPCDRYSDPYADSCWLFQGFVILRNANFDPGVAMSVCDSAPDGRAERCYESVGHQLAGLFQRGDAWIIEQCGKGKPELAPRCGAGAALALASVDWSGERVAKFCSAVPSMWMTACMRAAAEVLDQVASPVQRAALCSSRPENSAFCRASNWPRGAANTHPAND